MSELKLLPCPFCGKPPIWFGSGENQRSFMIECETPGCVNPHVSYYDHATAIRVWNTREPLHREVMRVTKSSAL